MLKDNPANSINFKNTYLILIILFMEFLAEKYFEVSIAEKFEVRVVSFSVPKAPF